MDKFMNKDRFTYQQESERFVEDLRKFHASRGTPFYKIPLIQGKPVDLYLLYTTVSSLGGWNKVNITEQWDEIQHLFHIPKSCGNASHALKEIYIRYLNLYEKVHLHGADLYNPEGLEDGEDDRLARRKRANTPVATVPMNYNYRQHDMPDSLRDHFGLSKDFVEQSDYHKLEKSLMSGLPNEVDFAVNVVTLLSNEGKHIIHLSRAPQILDLLMAQVGIFTEGPSGYKDLYEQEWRQKLKRNFIKFWFDTVEDREIKELISPSPEDFEKDKTFEQGDYSGKGLLHLNRDLGITDIEGQRVLQVAVILRNLSFERENGMVLANHMTAFRFLMLCAHNKYSSLKQIGLDTLGNIAMQIILDPIDFRSTQLIIRTITCCLASSDKFKIVRGMEILGKLCQMESNEEIITANLEPKVYADLSCMLTVHDIQLIVYALEAMYQLSELGEEACNGIADTKNCVDTLVGLITIEAGSYGPAALQGIKVVEHQVLAPLSPQPLSPHHQHPVSHQRVAMPGPMMNRPAPHLMAAQQSHLGPAPRPMAPEQELLACNWLRTNYEVQPGRFLNRVEVYSYYMHSCTKAGQPPVLPAENFFNCIRAVYPSVEIVKLDHHGSGSSELVFKGLGKRSMPASFPQQGMQQRPVTGLQGSSLPYPSPQPQSPKPRSVLQQQLMAPPQNTLAFQQRMQQQISPSKPSSAPSPPTMPASSQSRPCPSPTLPSSPSSQSNLIKSLLANKVSQNMHRIQQLGSDQPMGVPAHSGPNVQSRYPSSRPNVPGHPGFIPQSDHLMANQVQLRGIPASGFLDTLQQVLEYPPSAPNRGRSFNRGKKSPGSSPSRSSSPRSNKGGSPRGNSPRRPGSPRSPRSYQLEVCAQVERAQDVVLHQEVAEEAKIERVENVCSSNNNASQRVDMENKNTNPVSKPIINTKHVEVIPSADSTPTGNGDKVDSMMETDDLRGSHSVEEKENKENNMKEYQEESPPSPVENGESHQKDPLRINGLPNGDMEDKSCMANGKPSEPISTEIDISLKKQDILARIVEGKGLKEHSHVMNGIVNHLPNGDLDELLGCTDKRRTSEKINGIEKTVIENGFPCSPDPVDKDRGFVETVENAVTTNKDTPKQLHPQIDKLSETNENTSSTENSDSGANDIVSFTSKKSEAMPDTSNQNKEPTSCANDDKFSDSTPAVNDEKMQVDSSPCLPEQKETDGEKSSKSEVPSVQNRIPTPCDEVARQQSVVTPPVEPAAKRSLPLEETPKSKKKKPSHRSSVDSRRSSTSSIASMVLGDYVCEWQNCKKSFESAKATLMHVFKTHLIGDGQCLWENCDKLHRKKLSLLTHLQDRHCTEMALKGAAMRRQQLMQTPNSTPTPSPAPPPPVYANDAAAQAIKRFAVKQPYQELMEPKEGPVTKHIRLTSSLILRNLARYSAHGRTVIKKHEMSLAYIAMSTVESSGAISNCLWEILNNH